MLASAAVSKRPSNSRVQRISKAEQSRYQVATSDRRAEREMEVAEPQKDRDTPIDGDIDDDSDPVEDL